MAKFFRKLFLTLKRRGVRGFISLFSGTVLAQLINLAFLPVLSRLYSPEAFGALSFVTSVSTLVTTVATLRLETAMMLPKRRETVQALLGVCFISAAVTSLVTGGVVSIIVRDHESLSEIPFLWVAVILTVYLSSLFALLGRLTLRKGAYSEIAKRSIVQSSVMGVSQVGLFALPLGAWGLIFGSLLGRSAGLLPMYRVTKEFFGKTSYKNKLKALREYWKFPLVFTPSSLLNAFGVQAPVVFVTFSFSVGHAGLLSMAERIIGAPMTMVGNVVGQVVDTEVSSKIRNGDRNVIKMFLTLSLALTVLALPVGAVFFLFGSYLTTFVLGSQWELAGKAVELMGITLALRFIATPMSQVIGLFQRARGMITIDAIRTILTIISMLLIYQLDLAFLEAVSLFYISLGCVYVITWVYALRVVVSEARG